MTQSSRKKVVYLLGAGASAQALPVVSEFSTALQEHAVWVQGYGVNTARYTAYLNSLAGTITPFGTVDTYARGLYIQGGRDAELNKLKLYLSIFFLLEQWHAVKGGAHSKYSKKYDIDPRYMGWLALMMGSDGRMREGVNVLSWNYDIQVQMPMSRFLGSKSILDAQRNTQWFNHPVLIDERPRPDGLPFLIQLNGMAGYLTSEQQDQWLAKDATAKELRTQLHEWLDMQRGLLAEEQKHYPSVKDAFTFAWEDSPIAREGRRHARVLLSQADVLVAIGYSFPLFNREVDKELLDAFVGVRHINGPRVVHPKRVIIQNSNEDAAEEFIEAFNWKREGYPVVQHVKKVHAFHVPHELF